MYDHLPYKSETITQHFYLLISKVETFPYYSSTDLSHMSSSDRSKLERYVRNYAQSDQAQNRIDDLEPIARQRLSKSHQEGVKTIVMIIGGFACSTPAKILAAGTNLGALAPLIGFGVGCAWAWFVDDRATKAIGEQRCCHSSKMAVRSVGSIEQNSHFLKAADREARLSLIQKVESASLHPPYRGDLSWAIIASIIEVMVAFWVTLPGGLLMACFVAGFPITLIWLTSLYEADRIEFEAWAGDKVRTYGDKVRTYSQYLPDFEVSEKDLIEVTNLDAKLQFYTAARPDGFQSPQGAAAKAREALAFQEMQGWDVAANQAEKALTAKYKADLKNAKNKPKPKRGQEGYRDFEVPPSYQQATREWEESVRQEQEDITQTYQEDLEALQKDYGRIINHWNAIRLEAIAEFDFWERNPSSYPDAA